MSEATFQTTRWTLVLAAGEGAERALNELCAQYRAPLVAYVKGRGWAEAEDLVQGFFERLLRLESVGAVRRERGRFRAFLLAACNHYLSDEWDRAKAAKRGRGQQVRLEPEAWDAVAAEAGRGPDAAFDRAWALALLERVLARLQAEQAAAGKAEWFALLAPCLGGRTEEAGQREVAVKLGMNEPALRVALHRLRQRYRRILREEVAQTVADEAEVEAELRHLLAAVRGE